ncbi:MAG: NAD-dependent epimerase/dehydratase family protein [bacterium]
MKNKTSIVTGGSGFIGSHLVEALIKDGQRVVVIDKQKPDKNRKINDRHVKYQIMDVRDPKLASAFKKIKPEAVYHLAAHIDDRESVREPVMNADNNILGTINVCEATSASKAKKLVFASSCAAYGIQKKLPVNESMDAKPMTPYGYSKLAGEWYLDFFNRERGLSTVALRFGNVYGPRQDSSAESGVITVFTNRLLKGEKAFINNDGKTTRDYVYVGDVVNALVQAGKSSYVGFANVGTGIETRTDKIYKMVSAAVGSKAKPEYRRDVKDLLKCIVLDIGKAKKELKWSPQVDLETGLARTVDWYRARLQ